MTLAKEEVRLGAIKRCLKGKSILVVDDDPAWSHALVKLLESLGASVNTAVSGSDCIRLLRSVNFDLILLDIMMPGIDGWDVFAMMKNILNGRTIPVLVLTGLSREGVAENLARLPIPENQVLQKNSPPETILQAIYKTLQD
ncbi:MAG: response regulator [Verrucomicrobiales bacterium]|jgi:CheY-like chemotaxis protein|nr:response regulator [Verrucomicrobiales bacterium]